MTWSALLLSAAIGLAATPALAADDPAQGAASSLVARFMQAWSAADASGISALFADDADFINPEGYAASGRDHIAAFYASAFTRGYAGSQAIGHVVSVHTVAPEVAVIDGTWQIAGAKTETGAVRPAEKGLLVAVIRKDGDGWRIVSLRESSSATAIVPLSESGR
jgi:uncharacterized protein (TIGR02246 family)